MSDYQKAIQVFKQMKSENNPLIKVNKIRLSQLLQRGDVNAFCDLAIESLENAGHFEVVFGKKKND